MLGRKFTNWELSELIRNNKHKKVIELVDIFLFGNIFFFAFLATGESFAFGICIIIQKFGTSLEYNLYFKNFMPGHFM